MPWDKFSLAVNRPGMKFGHQLRNLDVSALVSTGEKTVDTLIIGSGAAGLTAAWNLHTAGYKNFAVLAGPEVHGNAAALNLNNHACPSGAHYLPLPSVESHATRKILHSMGVLNGAVNSLKPSYDERVLVHSPAERVLFQGTWQYGLIPEKVGVQKNKFLALIAALSNAVGKDGRRAFAVPLSQSSQDSEWRQFDAKTFADWLANEGFTDEHLLHYLDYCCRDEYGAGLSIISAWAGLHYFCSRSGHATNAEDGAVLTWPDGLSAVMRFLEKDIRDTSAWLTGTALSVRKVGASVHCYAVNDNGEVVLLKASKVVMATPLYVSARLLPEIPLAYKDWQQFMPCYQPWLVANFLFKHQLPEKNGAELSWDSVIHPSKNLGFVNAKHQEFTVAAATIKPQLLTAYHAVADAEPLAMRRWLATCSDDELLSIVTPDLIAAYGSHFWRFLNAAHITVRAHGMPSPRPGYLSNPLRSDLGNETGSILFANADLSGYSVFEEAAYWGALAAQKILG
jgi:protoporphyrinogen oxidase